MVLKILAAHIIIKNYNEINCNNNVYKSVSAKLILNKVLKLISLEEINDTFSEISLSDLESGYFTATDNITNYTATEF